MAVFLNTTIDDTGSIQLPAGTIAQRPVPTSGMIRCNTETGRYEFYNGSYWIDTATGSPSIITDGRRLHLDVGNPRSYPGEGTIWYDASGNGNIATFTNGPVYTSGTNGYFTFDGVDDFASIANSTSLQVADTFTINSWVYPTNLSGRYGIFSTRTNNAAGSWQLEVGTANAGTGRVAVTGVGTWIFESVNNAVTINNWFNVCFVKPNNATQGGTLYVNGTSIGSVVTTAYTILNNNDNKVIAQGSSGSQLFPGRISHVSLYNVALTADQVTQNFNAFRGRYGV